MLSNTPTAVEIVPNFNKGKIILEINTVGYKGYKLTVVDSELSLLEKAEIQKAKDLIANSFRFTSSGKELRQRFGR